MSLVITEEGPKWQESFFEKLQRRLRMAVPNTFRRCFHPSHRTFREHYHFRASLNNDNSGRLSPAITSSDESIDCAPTFPPASPEFMYDRIGEHEIRLLTILPSPLKNEPIETFLTCYSRDEELGYAAVSYTWGNTKHKSQIQCNGMPLKIGRNCKAALGALRLTTEPRTIWIDAICINQADLVERQVQVAAMGDVFRLAAETFAYLGESSQSWDFSNHVEDKQWQALFDKPWFCRTWVVQEVLFSKKLTILIGNETIPWNDLVALCEAKRHALKVPQLMNIRSQFIHEYGGRPPKSWDDASGPEFGIEIDDGDDVMVAMAGPSSVRPTAFLGNTVTSLAEHQRRADQKPDLRQGKDNCATAPQRTLTKPSGHVNLKYWRLPQILKMTHEFKCQDPRDKLFAILPLFYRPIPQLLCPSYQKTVGEVFTDLTWYLLETGEVSVFSSANGLHHLDMPSWVTYWSDQNTKPYRQVQHHVSCKAGFGSAPREVRAVRSSQNDRLIILRGMQIGLVQSTCKRQIITLHLKDLSSISLTLTTIQRANQPAGTINSALSWSSIDWIGDTWKSELFDLFIERFCTGLVESIAQMSTRFASTVRRSRKIKKNKEAVDESHGFIIRNRRTVGWWSPQGDMNFDLATQILQAHKAHYPWGKPGTEEVRLRDFDKSPLEFSFSLNEETPDLLSLEDDFGGLTDESVEMADPGDTLCIFLGFEYPFLLRKAGEHWQLVGECEVRRPGVMEGELVDKIDPAIWWEEPCPPALEDFVLC